MVTITFIVAITWSYTSLCQNQRLADSLKFVLESTDTFSSISKADIINLIVTHSAIPDEQLTYANTLLELAVVQKLERHRIKALQHKGVAFRLKGDLKRSLECLLEAVELATLTNFYNIQTQIYLEIATTYTTNNDYMNALFYEKKAIEILRNHGKRQTLAINLLNTGYVYYELAELDSALLLYNEAEAIFEEVGLEIGKAYSIGNRALVYWKQGDLTTAEQDLLKAIDMLIPLGDQYGMADYHNQLGRIYLEQSKIDQTILHTEKALEMAEALDLKEQIRDASLLLSELYTEEKQYQQALTYQTQYMAFKDSIENTEQTKKMADMRTEFEVNLREKEIDALEKDQKLQQTQIVIAIILLLLSMVILLYFRQRFRTTRLKAAVESKRQSDRISDLLSTQETKALQAMVHGKENERKRLAKELHNHLGSLMATIKVNLNALEHKDSSRQKTIVGLVDQACQDIRSMSHAMNMGVSKDFGLEPALNELANHLKASGDLDVELTTSTQAGHISTENEIIIYRIIQELVSNALKHADASKLAISLTALEQGNLINILVEDDGKGFDEKQVSKRSNGIGLSSLEEMVHGLDGEINIDSHNRRGTTISIDLPINAEVIDEYDQGIDS